MSNRTVANFGVCSGLTLAGLVMLLLLTWSGLTPGDLSPALAAEPVDQIVAQETADVDPMDLPLLEPLMQPAPEMARVERTLRLAQAGDRGRVRTAPAADPPEAAASSRAPESFNPQQVEDMLAVLKEMDEPAHKRIRELLERQPDRAQALLREQWPMLNSLMQLRRRDPDMFRLRVDDYRLNRQCLQIARQAREAGESNDARRAEERREELRRMVQRHFEVRQTIRERELARLEEEVNRLRQQIEARRAAREDLINRQMQQLLNDAARVEW